MFLFSNLPCCAAKQVQVVPRKQPILEPIPDAISESEEEAPLVNANVVLDPSEEEEIDLTLAKAIPAVFAPLPIPNVDVAGDLEAPVPKKVSHKCYFDASQHPAIVEVIQKTYRTVTGDNVKQYVHFSTDCKCEMCHSNRLKFTEKRCFYPTNWKGMCMMAPGHFNEVTKGAALPSMRSRIRDKLGLGPDSRPCIIEFVEKRLAIKQQGRKRKRNPTFLKRKAELKRHMLLDRQLEKMESDPALGYVKGQMYSEDDKAAILAKKLERDDAIQAAKPVVVTARELWDRGVREGLWQCPSCHNVLKAQSIKQQQAHMGTQKCIKFTKQLAPQYEMMPPAVVLVAAI